MSFWLRDQMQISLIAGRIFAIWVTIKSVKPGVMRKEVTSMETIVYNIYYLEHMCVDGIKWVLCQTEPLKIIFLNRKIIREKKNRIWETVWQFPISWKSIIPNGFQIDENSVFICLKKKFSQKIIKKTWYFINIYEMYAKLQSPETVLLVLQMYWVLHSFIFFIF